MSPAAAAFIRLVSAIEKEKKEKLDKVFPSLFSIFLLFFCFILFFANAYSTQFPVSGECRQAGPGVVQPSKGQGVEGNNLFKIFKQNFVNAEAAEAVVAGASSKITYQRLQHFSGGIKFGKESARFSGESVPVNLVNSEQHLA